jgi:hypothetical protein
MSFGNVGQGNWFRNFKTGPACLKGSIKRMRSGNLRLRGEVVTAQEE